MRGQPNSAPSYTRLSEGSFSERVETMQAQYESCHLCAHECGVDRTAGETGACGADDKPIVASSGPHHGEEPVLSGHHGSGTIFLANCNLACVFCQNVEISQQGRGTTVTAETIAQMALDLQQKRCHNVNFVTPTHFAPHLIEAIHIARDRGLEIPVVWNCGGYERPEILSHLDGIVDIYMPDVKWSNEQAAVRYSGAPGYWETVKGALKEMHRQVGDLTVAENGLATEGLHVRHLLMPDHVKNAKRVLSYLAEEISTNTYVNLLSQYRPQYKVPPGDSYKTINRPVTAEEYHAVIEHAREVGLERLQYDQRIAETGVSR